MCQTRSSHSAKTYIHNIVTYIAIYLACSLHIPSFLVTENWFLNGLICKKVTSNFLNTVHRKILAGEKLANLANHELFVKVLLANIHKNVFGICTDLFIHQVFLTNNFYLYGLPKSPCQIFLCTV